MVSNAGINTLVAERKRKVGTTKPRQRLALLGTRMLVGIIAVGLISLFSSGGENGSFVGGIHLCCKSRFVALMIVYLKGQASGWILSAGLALSPAYNRYICAVVQQYR